jgi:hypothetical protein
VEPAMLVNASFGRSILSIQIGLFARYYRFKIATKEWNTLA